MKIFMDIFSSVMWDLNAWVCKREKNTHKIGPNWAVNSWYDEKTSQFNLKLLWQSGSKMTFEELSYQKNRCIALKCKCSQLGFESIDSQKQINWCIKFYGLIRIRSIKWFRSRKCDNLNSISSLMMHRKLNGKSNVTEAEYVQAPTAALQWRFERRQFWIEASKSNEINVNSLTLSFIRFYLWYKFYIDFHRRVLEVFVLRMVLIFFSVGFLFEHTINSLYYSCWNIVMCRTT